MLEIRSNVHERFLKFKQLKLQSLCPWTFIICSAYLKRETQLISKTIMKAKYLQLNGFLYQAKKVSCHVFVCYRYLFITPLSAILLLEFGTFSTMRYFFCFSCIFYCKYRHVYFLFILYTRFQLSKENRSIIS